MATSEGKSAQMLEHDLTEREIDERATSVTPFFNIHVKSGKDPNTKSLLCYLSTETYRLLYPPEEVEGNQSVVLKVVKLSKESGSDQVGYVVSSPLLQNKYLEVTEQSPTSTEKFAVKFTAPKQIKPQILHQSQLFQLHKDPNSETNFAFYVTVVGSKGENKVCYLKPESGVIVAEESGAPDGYHCFSLTEANSDGNRGNFSYDGEAQSAQQVLQEASNGIVRPFIVEVTSKKNTTNPVSLGFHYQLYSGNHLMRYRPVDEADYSFLMWMKSTPSGNTVTWSNYVTPSYCLTVTPSEPLYGAYFLPGSGSSFNVVQNSNGLLAFTTTYTDNKHGTYNLYLSTDCGSRSADIVATKFTRLPEEAYMFRVYKAEK